MATLTNSKRLNYLLGKMDIFTPYDVINHLPRRYENLNYTNDKDLLDKQRVVLLGNVVSLPKQIRTKRITIITFDFITSSKRSFKVKAFNRAYLGGNINLLDDYTLIGNYDKKNNTINFINMYKGEIPLNQRIKPVYSLPTDYQQHLFSSLVNRSLKEVEGHVFSSVPYFYLNKYKLINKEQAIKWAHFPENMEQVHQSLRHLKYEEALLFSLKNQLIREDNKALAKAKKEPIDLSLCEPFLKTLPYTLTDDQVVACEEIINDMNQNALMYRLLQGDVGTGKTLVSFICLYANYLRGDQGALMAPTDSLARQHYENAKKIFEGTKLKIALLLGSTSISEKHRIYDDLEDGTLDIVIGTHALFSKGVNYSSLGLAIIDEQHRFGVNQRIALSDKGEHCDLLMMSATPIPRSLALSIYGDLDVSTLAVFPSKHRDVHTEIVASDSKKIFAKVDEALENDKQVYVIAPLIDFKEDERYSVDQLFARFALKYKSKVGLLHGKLKTEEKEQALENFYNGTTPILVSTTVIEVGIDVKKANTMIIYDASNFSLASLHQLRGRIGRDGSKAICLLTNDDKEEDSINRLKVIVDNEDGFKIAEEDMKLRGPGELTGIKQSGIPNFSFLNIIDDYRIFECARNDAKDILKNKNNDSYKWIINKAKTEVIKNPLIKG